MKFKLVGGNHDHYGKLYVKGDVIDCDIDLREVFRGKFERAEEGAKVTKAPDMPSLTAIVPRPNAVKPIEITKMTPQQNPPAPVKKEKEESKKESDKAYRGKEVTEKFSKAVENDFKVFIFKRKHFVYDPDDMTSPINKKPLIKKEVEPFINNHLEE